MGRKTFNVNKIKEPRKKLVNERQKHNLSQIELSEQIDALYNIKVSASHLSQIETGSNNPGLEVAKAIANFFGKSVDELFC